MMILLLSASIGSWIVGQEKQWRQGELEQRRWREADHQEKETLEWSRTSEIYKMWRLCFEEKTDRSRNCPHLSEDDHRDKAQVIDPSQWSEVWEGQSDRTWNVVSVFYRAQYFLISAHRTPDTDTENIFQSWLNPSSVVPSLLSSPLLPPLSLSRSSDQKRIKRAASLSPGPFSVGLSPSNLGLDIPLLSEKSFCWVSLEVCRRSGSPVSILSPDYWRAPARPSIRVPTVPVIGRTAAQPAPRSHTLC